MNIYPFSSDAETGISSDKTYTHAVNLGAASTGETIVNGVPFINASGDGEVNGYGWIGVEGNLHGGGNTSAIGTPSTEAVYALINPFIFEARSEYIILTNLTPDTVYDFRIYTRSWELGKTRKVLFTLFPDYHLSPSWQVDMDNTFSGIRCKYWEKLPIPESLYGMLQTCFPRPTTLCASALLTATRQYGQNPWHLQQELTKTPP